MTTDPRGHVLALYPWLSDLRDYATTSSQTRAYRQILYLCHSAGIRGPAIGGDIPDLIQYLRANNHDDIGKSGFGKKTHATLLQMSSAIFENGNFSPPFSRSDLAEAIALYLEINWPDVRGTNPAYSPDPKPVANPVAAQIERMTENAKRTDARIARLERDFRAAEIWKKEYDDRVANAIEDIRRRMDAIEAGEIGQSAQQTRSEHDQMIAQIKMLQASMAAMERRIYGDE